MNQEVILKELGTVDRTENGPIWHRLDYDKDAIVEASAGTGKTYTLERIVLKLVCEKKYDVRNLLLVTFTEKAAGELKDRIRKILTSAGVDMSHFDEATIGTIHSFCRELLSQYPFESGMQMSLDVASSDDSLIEKAVHDTIAGEEFKREYGERFSDKLRQLKIDLRKKDTDSDLTTDCLFEKVCKIVRRAIERGPAEQRVIDIENALGIVKICSQVRGSDDSGNTLCSISIGEYIGTHLNKAKDQYKKYFSELDDRIKKLSSSDVKEREEAIRAILEGKTDFSGYTWDGEKKSGEDKFCKVFPQIERLKAAVEGLRGALCQTFADDVAQMAWEKFRKLKAQTKLITFDDMVLETSRAVADAAGDKSNKQKQAFLESVRRKFRIALVDEFQDTDNKQWTIFNTLFSAVNNCIPGADPERGCLIAVGDPKQAIYSFRGADIATYLRAKRIMEKHGGQSMSLYKMYRSTNEMVTAFNKIFKADDWFTDMRVGDGEIKYGRDVEFPDDAPQELKEFAYHGECAVDLLESLPDGEKQGNRAKCLSLYMENAALEMKRLHEAGIGGKRIPWGEMSVLVRSKDDGDDVQKILRSHRIPCIRYKETGLFDSPESESVLALFDYLVSSRNAGNLASLLLTPFFRFSLCDMESRIQSGNSKFDSLCDKWRTFIAKCEWERFFESAMVETELGKPHPDDMDFLRRRTGIRQIFDRLLEQCGRARSLQEFISTLREWKRDDENAGENGSIRNKESDEDAVKIMTMHVSKGLEFGAVFIPWGFGEIVSSKLVPDKADRLVAGQEMRRLLYVALTRAKYKLYLPWSANVPKGGFGSAGAALRDLFLAKGIKALLEGDKKLAAIRGSNKMPEPWSLSLQKDDARTCINIEDLPPIRGMKSWRYHWDSFSSLNHPKAKEGAAEPDTHLTADERTTSNNVAPKTEAEVEERDTLVKKGAVSGTVFHEVMERLCRNDEASDQTGFSVGNLPFEEAAQECDGTKLSLLEIVRRRMKANGVVNQMRDNDSTELAFARMAWNALRTEIKIGDDTFRLCDIEYKDRKAEVGFVYDEGLVVPEYKGVAGVLNGSIDLVVRRPDGRYVIIDWKTNALTNYEKDTIEEEMKEAGYKLQYKIYTVAAEKWLGENKVKGVAYIFVRKGEYGENESGLYPEVVEDRRHYHDRIKWALGVRDEKESEAEKEAL